MKKLLLIVWLLSTVFMYAQVRGDHPTIGWGNLQWPPNAVIGVGDSVTAYAQIWIDGVTNQPGATPGLEAWIGYSSSNSNPATWTSWIPASFNVDAGNNDEFKVSSLGKGLPAGTYYYASRFKYNSEVFYYGGVNGEWNGTTNPSGVLTITSPPTLLSPANLATAQPLSLLLQWSRPANAVSFRLQVATDASFQSLILNDSTLTDTSYNISGLLNNRVYYWRVNAKDNNGNVSAFSSSFSFSTVYLIGYANLQFPQSGNILVGDSLAIYARVWVDGKTNQSGATPNLEGWIGYSTSNTNPSTWTNWVPASFNIDAGNNDEFWVNNFGKNLPKGSYYYASRFRFENGDYAYGGYSTDGGGFWNGTTNISGTLTVTPRAINAPSSLIASAISPTQINLNWTDNSTNETNFVVQRKNGDSTSLNSYSTIATLAANALSYSDNTVLSNTQYTYRVYATNADTSSGFSNQSSVTTPSLIAPALISPANNAVNQALNTTLVWTRPTGAVSFRVQVATDSLFQTLVLNDSTITDTLKQLSGLSNNKIYFWRVNAKDAGGNVSAFASAYRFSTQYLIGYANLQWPAAGQIQLGDSLAVYARVWIDGKTNQTGATPNLEGWIGYSTSNTNPNTWTNWVPATFNIDAGNNDEFWVNNFGKDLPKGNYYYASRFRFENGDYAYGGYSTDGGGFWNGTNNVSGILSVTPRTINTPSSLIASAISPTQINLNWTDNSTNETNFVVQRKNGDSTSINSYSTIATLTANAVSYSDNAVLSNTKYTYRVYATNADTSSGLSNQSSVTTPSLLTPTLVSPANNAVNQALNTTLVWTRPTGAVSFRVQVATDSLFQTLVLNDSTVTDTLKQLSGLSNNRIYFWRVNAKDAGGNVSAFASAYRFSTQYLIGYANLQWPATGQMQLGDSIAVYARVWIDGKTNQTGATPNLEGWIGYSTSNTNPNTWTNWVPATFNVDAGNNDEFWVNNFGKNLPKDTYYYASRFRFENGDYAYGGYSTDGGGFWNGTTNISGTLTVTPRAINAPSSLIASAISPTQINLNWTDNSTNETNFVVQRKNGDSTSLNSYSTIATLAANALSYSDNTVLSNTQYTYRVYATNVDTSSGFSNQSSVTTPSLIAPTLVSPTNNAVNQALNTTLVWTRPTGAVSFRVQVATDSLFQTLVLNDSTITDTLKQLSGLSNNKIYFWRVNAKDAGGNVSAFASAYRFSTQYLIGYANLQWPAAGQIQLGDSLAIYARVWVDGKTNQAGATPNLEGWIGYSTSNTNPSTWTNWVPASFNVDAGNNDEFWVNNFGKNLPKGTYYFASRFRFESGDYAYGGYSTDGGGFWNGTNNVSGTLTVTPRSINAPSSLSATAGSPTQVNLSWTDNSTNETNFVVQRKNGDSASVNPYSTVATLSANVTTYSDNTVLSNTQYTYRVYSTNADTSSGLSNQSSVTTPSLLTPTLVSPANNAVNQALNTALVWTRPTGGVSFRVQVATDSLFQTLVLNDSTVTDTLKQLSGLSNNRIYFWRVNAKDAGGNVSAFASAYRFSTQYLIGYANLQWPATGQMQLGDSIAVYARVWIDGKTNQTGATPNLEGWIGYSTSNTNPNTWTNWVPATFNVDAGNNDEFWVNNFGKDLPKGNYYYASRFRFENGDYAYGGYSTDGGGFWNGTNNVSGVLSVRALPIATPANLTALNIGIKKIRLDWSDNANNETGYTVERKTGDTLSALPYQVIASLVAGANNYVDTLLNDTTLYTYRVRAFNADTVSLYSNQTTIMTLIPVEFAGFQSSITGTFVNLVWDTKTEKNNMGFQVERKTDQGWIAVGFVKGSGTTTEPKTYRFKETLPAYRKDQSIEYRLKQIDYSGTFEYSPVITIDLSQIPLEYALYQNYPNPFNPMTNISFSVPERTAVTLTLFNALGEKIKDILSTVYEAGVYTIQFSATDIPSGVYYYQLSTGKFRKTAKMVVLK